jgi:predicted metal-dependent peptidase
MLSIGKQLTAEQRLSKALVSIMSQPKYTALAGVLMIGEKTINDMPTACTNGRDEMYGREFVDNENYHKLYQHLTTWKHLWKIDPNTANQAMDYVINIKIMDDNTDGFAVIPKGGLIDAQYRDMDTAQVFDLIRQSNDDNDDGGMDEHDWEGAQDLSDEEKGALARDIDEAIRQGALAAGKMGGTDSRELEELLKPQVDWREVLREFISTTCAGNDYSTWARPNRRLMSQGVYMPSGISQSVGELVVAIDTSGSINKRTLTTFLSEVKSICDTVHPEQVRLLYWGHEVVGDESYKTDELDGLTTSTKPMGGGGTDVNCVTQYMTAKGINPQACIVLTDGYLCGNWGEWSCPVLWTVIDNKSAVPTTGTAIHIKSGDM